MKIWVTEVLEVTLNIEEKRNEEYYNTWTIKRIGLSE